MVWATPVTGSSSTPSQGAKNRDTKSTPGPAPGAVTATPMTPPGRDTLPSAPKSGRTARTSASVSSTTSATLPDVVNMGAGAPPVPVG